MKYAAILLAAWLLFVPPALAGRLDEAETAALREDITEMLAAFEAGDASLIIERTHASLPALMGGHENFVQVTQHAMQQLEQGGVRFEHLELGERRRRTPWATRKRASCPRFRWSICAASGRKARRS